MGVLFPALKLLLNSCDLQSKIGQSRQKSAKMANSWLTLTRQILAEGWLELASSRLQWRSVFHACLLAFAGPPCSFPQFLEDFLHLLVFCCLSQGAAHREREREREKQKKTKEISSFSSGGYALLLPNIIARKGESGRSSCNMLIRDGLDNLEGDKQTITHNTHKHNKQTNKQTNRQTDRQTNKQTDKHTAPTRPHVRAHAHRKQSGLARFLVCRCFTRLGPKGSQTTTCSACLERVDTNH